MSAICKPTGAITGLPQRRCGLAAYVDSAQFPRMVRPIVEYIASRTEEHASVGVVDEDELVYIARSRHTPFNSTSVRLGERVPIFCRRGDCGWLRCRKQSVRPSCSA